MHEVYVEYTNCRFNAGSKVFHLIRLSFTSYLYGPRASDYCAVEHLNIS